MTTASKDAAVHAGFVFFLHGVANILTMKGANAAGKETLSQLNLLNF